MEGGSRFVLSTSNRFRFVLPTSSHKYKNQPVAIWRVMSTQVNQSSKEEESITVQFKSGTYTVYTYTYGSAGADSVETMKSLARQGHGLNLQQ